MTEKIISPCISICKTDPVTGFCYAVLDLTKRKSSGKMKRPLMSGKLKILKLLLKE